MMETPLIEEQARKLQTTKDNIAREYCQHLFLSKFFRQGGSEGVLFKGGTALRILWQSPRFSEDLDFSGKRMPQFETETKVEAALIEVEREGLTVNIRESKRTTGGYLGKLIFEWGGFEVSIQIEISQRKSSLHSEQTLVQSDFFPPYVIFHLAEQEMIREKILAFLERGKPRDFFDLYFILRSRRDVSALFRKDKTLEKRVLEKLVGVKDNAPLLRELRQFLPTSYHALLRDFPSLLEKELQRALPNR